MKNLIFTIALLIVTFFSFSQTESKWHIGLEGGGGDASGEINDAWSVRQSINSYNSYYEENYNSGNLVSYSDLSYFGLKTEYSFNKNLSFATGIRYLIINSNFSGYGRYGNYFYLKTSDDNATSTNFFRVKSIDEMNYYIGIPLEIKYTPFYWGKFGFYAKMGEEAGYLINNKIQINFLQESMNIYQNEVLNSVKLKPNPFYAKLNLGIGVNFTTRGNWMINLDLIGNSYLLTSKNSTLMNLKSVNDLQLSIMAPINFSRKK